VRDEEAHDAAVLTATETDSPPENRS